MFRGVAFLLFVYFVAGQRLCNPANVSDTNCVFCNPTASVGNTGCLNFGYCLVHNDEINGEQIPYCSCQAPFLGPQCQTNIYQRFNAYQVYNLRWMFAVFFLLVAIFAGLLITEHLYYYKKIGQMTQASRTHIWGLVFCVLSALFAGMYLSYNPAGIQFGYHSVGEVFGSQFLLSMALVFAGVAVSIITGNWISVATVTPSNPRGYPWIAKVLVVSVSTIMTLLAFVFSGTQVLMPSLKWMFLTTTLIVVCLLMFVFVSGFVVLSRIMKSNTKARGREGRLRRMAMQLIVLSLVEILSVIALSVVAFLPGYVFSSLSLYYGIGIAMPLSIFLLFLIALCAFLRFAVWQVKLTENIEKRDDGYVKLKKDTFDESQ